VRWSRMGVSKWRDRLTPTAPPKNLAVCNTVLCTVAVLTLQLSLPVTQPLVPLALEQVCTWTSAGTAPDAISCHGARKYAIAEPAPAGPVEAAPPHTGDEENITHCPQSVTLMGSCPIESTVLQIAVVTGVKSVWQPLSPRMMRAFGSARIAVGEALLVLAGVGR
jgi:hypothetical protein